MKRAKKAALLAELARLRAENTRLALALLEKDWRATKTLFADVDLARIPAAEFDATLRRMMRECPRTVATCEEVARAAFRVRMADALAGLVEATNRLCRPRP